MLWFLPDVLILTLLIWSSPQSRKANEADKDKKGLEARADSIGSGRAIPIKQVRLPVYSARSLCVFEASALINSEITHLTSIRVRGSPGSSNQIIRRRRGTDSPSLLFLPPLPLFIHSSPASLLPSKPLPFLWTSSPSWAAWSRHFKGMKEGEERGDRLHCETSLLRQRGEHLKWLLICCKQAPLVWSSREWGGGLLTSKSGN